MTFVGCFVCIFACSCNYFRADGYVYRSVTSMERSTKHEAKLILTWLISVAMIGL
jgi:hypothetical protein